MQVPANVSPGHKALNTSVAKMFLATGGPKPLLQLWALTTHQSDPAYYYEPLALPSVTFMPYHCARTVAKSLGTWRDH
jgi:hypothetical protein